MSFSAIRSLVFALLASAPNLLRAELEIHPRHFGASVDVGKIVHGTTVSNDAGQPITRTGVGIGTSATYDKKFDINLGMGGLFWYAIPELGARDKLLLFGFGVGQAEGVYKFGNPENPSATLHMGLFGHKYNPDAKNLGEYLFRSGTYPGYVWTGGWSYINSAAYLAQGFLLNLPTLGGKITHDLALYMERNISPTHDLSPTYLITVKPSSIFEFGAGLIWSNGLSFKGDKVLQPKHRLNAYHKVGPYAGVPLSLADRDKQGYEWGDTAIVPSMDPRIGSFIADRPGDIYIDSAGNGTPNSELAYYTFKGFKAMARASVALGKTKMYAEWAWLGIKNQPYYYDKPLERMPVMMGIDIPTFGLLDMLAFEVDYRKSPYKNTLALAWDQSLPVPLVSQNDDPLLYRPEGRASYLAPYLSDPVAYALQDSLFSVGADKIQDEAKANAWHWSVYAKRKIIDGVSLTAQVASDHMRHFGIVFGTPNDLPATLRTKDWYYVLRLEFGI